MKKIMLTILFMFVFANSFTQVSVSGSGWQWIQPIPMGNGIFSMSIAPDGTIYICGEHGTLLKSTNNGAGYFAMTPVGEVNLKDIAAFGPSGLIVVGSDGARLSADAGNTWVKADPENSEVNGADAKGSNIIYAGDLGKIFASSNGGASFFLAYNNPVTDFNSCIFLPGVGNQNALAVGTNGKIYRSSDMGINWGAVSNPAGSLELFSISFWDANTGMVLGWPNKIFKTTDAGFNWIDIATLGSAINDIKMISNTTAVSGGEDGKIYYTSNGGTNWTLVYTEPSGLQIITIQSLINSNQILAWADNGVCATSYDGGLTWVPNAEEVRNITRIIKRNSADTTSKERITGNAGLYSESTDNGLTWTNYNTGTQHDLKSGYFINSMTGWLVGGTSSLNQRIILNTTNGGVNWTTQHISNSNVLLDIEFINATTGVAVGNFGTILRTTNAGVNWSSISGVTWTLQEIKFINANTGIAVGEAGRIFKTTNTGLNWTQVNSGGFFDMQFDFDFIDESIAVSVGSQGTMYRTTNGGTNWIQLPKITQNTLYGVDFANGLTGYACGTNLGNDCSVLKTTNAGLNWERQNTGTNNTLNSIRCINSNTVLAVGETGTILKTINGGAVGVQSISNEIPKTYLLSQNYPNPFNPKTKIKFQVSKPSNVTITIYNILGKEVAAIVNEFLKAAAYEVEWNAINYPSGVYFYRMETNSFTETKKMLLVK